MMQFHTTRIFILLLLFSQNSIAQPAEGSVLKKKITLEVTNLSVAEILKQIEQRAQVSFSYNSDLFDGARRVTISFKNRSVEEAIKILFDGKIKGKAKENHIILVADKKAQIKKSHGRTSDTAGKKIIVRDTVIIRDTVVIVYRDSVILVPEGMRPASSEAGITGGLNYYGISGTENTSFTLGGSGGAYLNLLVSKKFSFKPALLFNVKGYNYFASEYIPPYQLSTDATQRFYYLEMPLPMQANILPYFYFHLGPYVSFLTNAYYTKTTTVNGILNNRNSGKNTDEYKMTDWGIIAAMDFQISRRIFFGIQYSTGLINISKEQTGTVIKNTVISAKAGYRLK
jgi:hypothetical protein